MPSASSLTREDAPGCTKPEHGAVDRGEAERLEDEDQVHHQRPAEEHLEELGFDDVRAIGARKRAEQPEDGDVRLSMTSNRET